jgi:predicted GIY-YIG superfamily endonuclease
MHHNYYVYIVSSKKRVLYTGMTNDLVHRVAQHEQGAIPGFTRRYDVDRLVYFSTRMTYVPRSRVRTRSRAGCVRRRWS